MVMIVNRPGASPCDCAECGAGQCYNSEPSFQTTGRRSAYVEKCSVLKVQGRRAFSSVTAATSSTSAPPPPRDITSSSFVSSFVASRVAGTPLSRAACMFRAGLVAARCWAVTTAAFVPSPFCASRVAGRPLSNATCFFRAGLVAVTDRSGDAPLATAQSRPAKATLLSPRASIVRGLIRLSLSVPCEACPVTAASTECASTDRSPPLRRVLAQGDPQTR